MKITYISASIIPSSSANSVNVMKMSRALASNGYDVTLVATKGSTKSDPFSFYGVKENFKLVLSKSGKHSFIHRLFKGLKLALKSDITYTRWPLAALFLIILRKKTIFEHHAPYKKGMNGLIEKCIMKSGKIQRHIFITDALKQYLLSKYPKISKKELLVLPDGADPVKNKANHYVDQNDIDCIYIGSFQEGKGIDTVIGLANRLPNINFAVVGGSNNEIIKSRAKTTNDNIKWFGHLPHRDTNQLLQRASITLLPNKPKVLVKQSNQDIGSWTSPMKLFEYMANEKPIVASDLEVLKEILVNEQNSLLARYDDYDEWINKIEFLLLNPDFAGKIAANAYEDFKDNYTWIKRAEKAIKGIN